MKLSKIVLFFLFVSIFTGCKSVPETPDWALKIPQGDNEYFYAIGQGRSLNQAKKVAANQINEQLWTQIQAETTQREVLRNTNGNENYQNIVDSNINSKSALITLTGIEYIKSEESVGRYYVKAKIKKESVKEQLNREIREIDKTAASKLARLNSSDLLTWWLENRDTNKLKRDLSIRLSMLSVFDSVDKYSLSNIDALVNKVNEVKDKIVIRVPSTSKEKKVSLFIAEALSNEGIKTISRNSNNRTHSIDISIDKRNNKIGAAYITTSVIELRLLNNDKKVLASNEIIATGNSVSGYKYSSEGSARHFKQQLDDSGIWVSLGINY